jgi:energy-coupling factor transporter ATP-binding protein EcfA2
VIHKIYIENFMSLKNVSIDLEPLTVFVGPNGSGKSAIFKAFVLLSKFINGVPVRGQRGEFKTEQGTTLDDLVWNSDSGLPIRFQVWFTAQTQEDPDYALEIKKLSEGWSVTRERMRSGNGWFKVVKVEYYGGLRNPHLSPITNQVDQLEAILAPRTSGSARNATSDLPSETTGASH